MERIKKHSIIYFIIALAFSMSAMICGYMAVPRECVKFRMVAIIFTVLMLILVVICYLAIFIWNWKIENVYLVEAFILGIIMTLLIPINVVPDEPWHIWSAYNLSNQVVGIGDNEDHGKLYMREDDYGTSLSTTEIDHEYYEYYYGLFNQKVEDTTMVETIYEPLDTPKYQYILSSMGITIGRILHLNTVLTFYLGRLFNMLLFIGIIYYCIKKIPFGKMVVMVIALLPMTLQQAYSYSYDSFIILMAMLVVTLTLHICYGDEDTVKKRDYVIMIVAALLLFPLKNKAYFAVSLIPTFILVQKRSMIKEQVITWRNTNKKQFYIITGIIAGILTVATVFAGYKVASYVISGGLDKTKIIEWTNTEGYSIGYFIRNPIEIFKVIATTLYNNGSTYYVLGFIGGTLGWFELEVPTMIPLFFILILFVATFRRSDENMMPTIGAKVYMNIFVMVALCCIFAGMLLGWTPMGLGYIEGVQGRYFIPLALAPLISLRSNRITVDKSVDRMLMLMIPLVYALEFSCLLIRA